MENLHINFEDILYDVIKCADAEKTPEATINKLIEGMGKHLQAERCYIFEQNGDIVRNTYEWVQEGVEPQIQNLQNIAIEHVSDWYNIYKSGKNVIIDDIEKIKITKPNVYNILAPQGIHSLITGPILDKGNIVGFYGIDNPPVSDMQRLSKFIDIFASYVITAIRARDIQILTYRDQLTDAKNRHALYRDLKAIDQHASIGVLYCDVIGLKQTNDREGHTAGDMLLVNIFKSIKKIFSNDNVYRIGGDEFIVIALNLAKEDLQIKALSLEQLIFDSNMNMSIGFSYSEKGIGKTSVDYLIHAAENDMYTSKRLFYSSGYCDAEEDDTRLKFTRNILESDCSNILDSLINIGLYVITEKDHRILYYNRHVKEVSPNIKLGMICHEVWKGTCDNCPLNSIGESAMSSAINYDDPFGDIVEITAIRIMWRDEIPAYLIRVAPLSERVQARNQTNPILAGNALCTYTIDKNYRIIAYSENSKNLYPQLECGKICYKTIFGKDEPCYHCSAAADFNLRDIVETPDNKFDVSASSIPMRIINGEKARSIVLYNSTYKATGDYKPGHELSFVNIENEKYRDHITGGYNRTGFITAVERLRATGIDLTNYAVLFVNIQGFKAVNRSYGIDAGDNLLRIVYMTFYRSILMPKIAARKESDHFVFLIEKDNLDLNVLSSNLELKWQYNNHEIRINCHAGIYYIRENDEDVQEMISRARLARNYIKDGYVQPYAVFDCYMEKEYLEQADVINNYEKALANNEFKVYYQPIIDTQTGKIVAAEALVRWFSSNNGTVPPNMFIPILEEYGAISKIDSFVLHSTYGFLTKRHKNNLSFVPISVNVSRMDFYDSNFLNEVEFLDINSELPKGMIRYEITETAYASMELLCNNFIDTVHKLGSKIVLDDFGTGYSSYAMIQNFNFDVLKIDMSFVRQLDNNPKVRSIISSIISMCHELNIKIVAEGVENEFELEFLKSKNCDFIQGYYFSRPLSEADFTKFLEENM